MSISSLTSNYVGRDRDISILQNPDASIPDVQAVRVGFGPVGRYCSGIQKLIQSYVVLLLTSLESQPTFPTFGTELYYKLRQGVGADLVVVRQLFSLANYAAVSAIKTYQAQTTRDIPADERLASASLVDISAAGDTLSFSVQLTTDAGESVPFVVPLPK